MNSVILYLKVVRFDPRPANVIKVRGLNINDTPAIQTDKMMMLVELGVETRCRTRVTGFGHEAKRGKRGQDTMHCHPRDLRQLNTDGAVKLFSSRMVCSAQNRFKDGASLGSDRQSAFAVCREKALHPLLFFCLTHLLEMSLCTR
jgi:hypothetical protein